MKTNIAIAFMLADTLSLWITHNTITLTIWSVVMIMSIINIIKDKQKELLT